MPDFLVFAAAFAKLAGARIVLDIHDPMPLISRAKFPGAVGRGLYPLLLWQERISAAFADRVLTVHEPLKQDILIADGIAEDKISVIANFPDEGIFKGRGPEAVSLPLRVVYYGTISSRFGLDTVLAAIAGLRHRDRLLFRIIGQGDAAAPLRRRISELGLGKVVDFENTSYPVRRLPGILSDFHLGLVPYAPSPATNYMLPVKLMELLAMGIPSITVPNAAIRHYLDERLYFGYDARNAETLTRLLDRILEDPTLVLAKRDAILGQPTRLLWESERSKYIAVLARLSK
jgi:glycosyltransferase involved in cell wall biosynthesis